MLKNKFLCLLLVLGLTGSLQARSAGGSATAARASSTTASSISMNMMMLNLMLINNQVALQSIIQANQAAMINSFVAQRNVDFVDGQMRVFGTHNAYFEAHCGRQQIADPQDKRVICQTFKGNGRSERFVFDGHHHIYRKCNGNYEVGTSEDLTLASCGSVAVIDIPHSFWGWW